MADNTKHKKFGDVLEQELDDMETRRRVAFPNLSPEPTVSATRPEPTVDGTQPDASPKTPQEAEQHKAEQHIDEQLRRAKRMKLVGLALSGGGVRSGAVSLGLLQSLYQGQVLDQFDYMSTVSGGGYAGTYLSAMISRLGDGATIDWSPVEKQSEAKPPPKQDNKERLPLAIGKDRRQSKEMRRLIYGGIYLRKFRELLSSTLFGVAVNWTMLIAGLTALAAVVAIFYRLFDMPALEEIPSTGNIQAIGEIPFLQDLFDLKNSPVVSWCPPICDVIEACTYAGDIPHALVPSIAIGCVWFGLLLARLMFRSLRWRPGLISAQSWASLFLVGSLLCSVVLIMNTGQIQLAPTSSASGPRLDLSTIRELQYWTWFALVLAIVIAVLPFLKRNDLARSGAASAPKWQNWVAKAAALAMLGGVPLLVFGLVVDEDLFDFNISREDRYLVTRSHVKDWRAFSLLLKREELRHAEQRSDPATPDGIGDEIAKAVGPSQPPGHTFARIGELEHVRRSVPQNYWLVGRWVRSILHPIDGPVAEVYRARGEARLLERSVAEKISEMLQRDDFHTHFPKVPPEPIAFELTKRKQTAEYAAAQATAMSLAVSKPETALAQKNEAIEVQKANRHLLELWYPDALLPPETVFAHIVWTNDQWNRICILFLSASTFIVFGLLINVNLTSAHLYYRQRLAEMWMPDYAQGSGMPFMSMKNTDCGGPYHLINSTVNLFGPRRDVHEEPTELFLFSRHFCGSDRVDYEPSDKYSSYADLTVADAMAISGAAVSPMAAMNNPLLFYALILTNARLGQWVRNPGDDVPLNRPAFIPALFSYLFQKPEKAAYLYVSDGGHHDNSGVESLLRRRCRVIVACDASWDPNAQFLDLLRLFRRMSIFEGIEFTALDGGPVSLASVVPDTQSKLVTDHLVLVRIRYPDSVPDDPFAWLIYVKPSLTGKERPELLLYREDNVEFPHDPTTDQFFDPRRFECYRDLGYHMGQRLCSWLNAMPEELGTTLWLKEKDLSKATSWRVWQSGQAGVKRPKEKEFSKATSGDSEDPRQSQITALIDELKLSKPTLTKEAIRLFRELSDAAASATDQAKSDPATAEKPVGHSTVALNGDGKKEDLSNST